MSGHWKAHCPVFLAKKKNNPDSGATDHICTTLQGFQEMRKLIRGEVSVFQADGSAAPNYNKP
ncbi:hypothetical protein KY284_023554 [Solanum tuberosum]|nr:hypothetical protein KY284_023554 [Solanum tuberosum]